MKNLFKQGQLVQVKSGGPPMTVKNVPSATYDDDSGCYDEAEHEYECIYFVDGRLMSDTFPEHVLKAYVGPQVVKSDI